MNVTMTIMTQLLNFLNGKYKRKLIPGSRFHFQQFSVSVIFSTSCFIILSHFLLYFLVLKMHFRGLDCYIMTVYYCHIIFGYRRGRFIREPTQCPPNE